MRLFIFLFFIPFFLSEIVSINDLTTFPSNIFIFVINKKWSFVFIAKITFSNVHIGEHFKFIGFLVLTKNGILLNFCEVRIFKKKNEIILGKSRTNEIFWRQAEFIFLNKNWKSNSVFDKSNSFQFGLIHWRGKGRFSVSHLRFTK